jgi:hypothetical protein
MSNRTPTFCFDPILSHASHQVYRPHFFFSLLGYRLFSFELWEYHSIAHLSAPSVLLSMFDVGRWMFDVSPRLKIPSPPRLDCAPPT